MLESLKKAVWEANKQLAHSGLVKLTWGNVSAFDRESGLCVIKPSGVAYSAMEPKDMVVVDLEGKVVEGRLRPSTDTPTHIRLYRAFSDDIGGIMHSHSRWASAWAQAQRPIPLLGTTHADLSPHPIPVTRAMTREEVLGEYEAETANVIIEALEGRSPLECPAVLVAGHGPFCWAKTPMAAVEVAISLEEIAQMAWATVLLEPRSTPLASHLVERHFFRKHGPASYYGQSGDARE